ncbi:hypothetical protein J2S06_002909, partial [Bacillus alveayuensis]|nr:hypothetical protein [Bacillus alveayuensis]
APRTATKCAGEPARRTKAAAAGPKRHKGLGAGAGQKRKRISVNDALSSFERIKH